MTRRTMTMMGLAGLLAAVAGCSASTSADAPVKFTDTPEGISHSAELLSFSDLGSMTATSDLVVKATVTSTGRGQTTGTPEDGGATTTREVTLRVDEVIYQKKAGQVPASIVLAEGYWNEAGVGYMSEGITWSEAGASGYYYLSGPDAPDHYSLVWSQGRVLLSDAGASISGHAEEGPWKSVDTSPNGVTALKASIAGAAQAASTGQATAVKPEMCDRAPELATCQG